MDLRTVHGRRYTHQLDRAEAVWRITVKMATASKTIVGILTRETNAPRRMAIPLRISVPMVSHAPGQGHIWSVKSIIQTVVRFR